MIEGFRDVLAMMVTIIGIAYPLVMNILRSSIKANEDWMTVALTSYNEMLFEDCYSADEERKKRGKVLGYYDTLDEPLGWQVIAGLWLAGVEVSAIRVTEKRFPCAIPDHGRQFSSIHTTTATRFLGEHALTSTR